MSKSKPRILIVEDEIIVARDIERHLQNLGYETFPPANSREQAIESIEGEKPDLVLMDIVIKGDSDGIATAQEIRERYFIPVIFLTAHLDDTLLQAAALTEPFGYLIKPFDVHELVATIKMALHKAEMENRLRLSEEMVSMTLQSIGDGVIATDDQGRVTSLNPVAQNLTGWELPDALGRPLEEVFVIINEDSRKPVETPVARVLREGVVVGLANHTVLVSKSGVEFPIDDSGAPIRNRDGEVMGVVLVFRDISEKRKAEEERNNLLARTQQAQKLEALGTLAGGIAHDFNNTLQVVLVDIKNIARQLAADHPGHESVKEIQLVVGRGRELVRQILTFTRMETAKPTPVDFCEVVEEAVNVLRSTIPAEIDIQCRMEAPGSVVLADATQLHQVIVNLCTNAHHAIEGNGTIEVSATVAKGEEGCPDRVGGDAGSCIRLSVKDDGVGIPASNLDKIFDPFFTTKSRGNGSGIGLAVVHGIVENHGGEIEVTSEEGEGTEVVVTFPTTDKPLPVDVSSPARTPLRGGRLLIAEDDAGLSRAFLRVLPSAGYEVTMCKNGREALERFRQTPDCFDLVLTDQKMPEMTGEQLCAELLALRPDLPVILLAGFGETLTPDKAEDLGFRGFFTKPVEMDELQEAMQNCLRG